MRAVTRSTDRGVVAGREGGAIVVTWGPGRAPVTGVVGGRPCRRGPPYGSLKFEGLGVGSTQQRHAGSRWSSG